MAKLNKEQLIKKMCESEQNLSKAAANRLVNLIFDEIVKATAHGEGATFPGFGSFTTIDTKARAGHNPATGDPIQIPAGKRIKFTPGKNFKDEV